MATVKVYKPADVECVVIDGDPPVDQSAAVAALEQAVADLTTANAALQAKIDGARTEAQQTVDALA